MKVIFMGTPDFSCPTLQKLIESNHEILAVYTQQPKHANRGMKIFKSKIHQLAENNNLKVETPSSLKADIEKNNFKNYNADIAIVAAYGMLLPKEILEGTKLGCINIHPSKLPRWRGAAPLQRALINGDKETSVCIMQMDEGLDTGDIILEKHLKLNSEINLEELHNLCADIGAELTLEALEKIESGKFTRKKQSEVGVAYATKITKQDELINFDKPAEEIHNQIRGISPYPGAYFKMDGKKYKIFKSEFTSNNSNDKAGTIINTDFEIACSSGSLKPLVIQKEGKKAVPIKDFLNGNKIESGKFIQD